MLSLLGHHLLTPLFSPSPVSSFNPQKILNVLKYILQFQVSTDAQQFVAKFLKPIVDTILDSYTANEIFHDILHTAIYIVGKDLRFYCDEANCTSLDALASLFDKNKKYYDELDERGKPEVRVELMTRFGTKRKGFDHLATALSELTSDNFPNIETVHLLLAAGTDATFIMRVDKSMHSIAKATMNHLLRRANLEKFPARYLQLVRYDLQRLCKKLALSIPQLISEFNQFWRSFTLKLIKSESQEHKQLGLKEIDYLLDSCRVPDAYIVKGAGKEFVNGRYEITSSLVTNGCISSQNITYETISDRGKKLIIQPCIMTEPGKSHCDVWYFLSDENGVDYYFHETHPNKQDKPPLDGWKSCPQIRQPPPVLEPSSNSIPLKDEKGNLEKQLKRWLSDNNVYGIILGGCIDEDHIKATTVLKNFLSKMNTPSLTCAQLELSSSIDRGANVLESILPLLASTGPRITSHAQTTESLPSSSTTSYFTAIDTAKQRLLAAQRWKESMESALQGYLDASREVEAARSSLLDLERSHGIIDVDAHDDDDMPQSKRLKTKE